MFVQTSNRYRVLSLVRESKRISRVEIAKATGLSRAAITNLAQNLIEDGLLLEHEQHGSGASAVRGRPRVMLELNPDAFHVIGVKMSVHQVNVALTDFTGAVLHTLVMPYRAARQALEVTSDVVEDAVRECIAEAGANTASVGGICVGIPGYIDSEAGICHWSPLFWKPEVRFGDELQRRLDIETWIENDANLVTLAERWFGAGLGRDCFAVVTVGHGIGMGLVANGALYRGAHGVGPEFGHATVDTDGPLCRCGRRGCVEAYVGDYGILRAVEPTVSIDVIEADPTSYHTRICDLTEQALKGDPRLMEIFREAGRKLGQGLANLVAILNPPAIIVTGAGLRAGALLSDAVREGLAEYSLVGREFDVELIFHEWGDEVWARGAAALVLERLYDMPSKNAVTLPSLGEERAIGERNRMVSA